MEALIVFIIFGSAVGMVLGLRFMQHRERMAELEARKAEALAKAAEQKAFPPERDELARELLAAYEEAGVGLRES